MEAADLLDLDALHAAVLRDQDNTRFAQRMRMKRGATCTHPAACCTKRMLTRAGGLGDGLVAQAVTCMACGAETTEFDSAIPAMPVWDA